MAMDSKSKIFSYRGGMYLLLAILITSLIGGFITCVAVGIVVLFASRNVFLKVRDYFLKDKEDGGNK